MRTTGYLTSRRALGYKDLVAIFRHRVPAFAKIPAWLERIQMSLILIVAP